MNRLNIKLVLTIGLIFFLNFFLVYAYIYFVIGTFDVRELVDGGGNPQFLPDVLVYYTIAQNSNLEEAVLRLITGTTSVHAVILGYFLDTESLLSGVVLNSAFIALSCNLLPCKNSMRLKSYALLSPFFMLYSIGWTKEIAFVLAIVCFMRYTLINTYIGLAFSFIFSMFSRPQFTPLLAISLLLKSVKKFDVIIGVLVLLSLSPIWMRLLPVAYELAAVEFYRDSNGQGISKHFDYLKMDVLLLSIIGFFSSAVKLYADPVTGIVNDGGVALRGWIEFYIELLFLFTMLRNWREIFKNISIFNLFVVTHVYITSLPFNQFRYLLPLLVSLIMYSIVVGRLGSNYNANVKCKNLSS